MYGSKLSLRAQRGVSLSGLIGVLAILVIVAVFGMKVIPTYAEYQSAKDAIAAAKAAGDSPSEARAAFSRTAVINAITSIDSSDLLVEKIDGQTEISFDYDKVIPLFKNVHLVIRYAATTAPGGEVREREADDTKKK